MSRIESGERQVGEDEVQTLLEAIGTPEAAHLLEILEREWSALQCPSPDHPDQDPIWEAEKAINQTVDTKQTVSLICL